MRIVLEVRSNHFGRLTERMRANAEAAVKRAVMDAEAQAKVLAPVDTGNLRNSLTGESDGLEGAVYTNVEYAPYQEFGTHKMAAHPFLIPAIESVAVQFQNDMRDVFDGS